MINRFNGPSGPAALVDELSRQLIVSGDRSLATVMAERGTLHELIAGEVLIDQGAADNDVYFIISGRIAVTVNGREVSQRSAHEHVGEIASIIPALPRTATGTAKENTLVLKLSSNDFHQLAETFPVMWRQLAYHMAHRLHQRNVHVPRTNTAIKVFVICSVEALAIARAIENQFQHDNVLVKIWTQGVFSASSYPLESLEAQLEDADFAIAVVQPDDSTAVRGVVSPTPRDNVIFELGMFVGRLGRKRSFLLEPRYAQVKLPSDLTGLTTIGYKTGTHADLATLMGPACNELRDKFNELGTR